MKTSYGLNRQRIIQLCFTITLLWMTNVSEAQTQSGSENRKNVNGDIAFFERSNTEISDQGEQMPEFPGGDTALKKYIIQHTKYPRKAVKDSISGKVITRFAIQPDGSTSDIAIVRGIRQDLDLECIRVITKMPKWNPGMQLRHDSKGDYWVPVKVWYSIHFIFTLDKKSTPKAGIIIRPK